MKCTWIFFFRNSWLISDKSNNFENFISLIVNFSGALNVTLALYSFFIFLKSATVYYENNKRKSAQFLGRI